MVINRKMQKDYQLFQVWEKQVRSPRTGMTLDVKAVDIDPWVMILAITPENKAVMVRQYRHGIEKICLELPGGLVDCEDPSPEVTARRELREETGYAVTNMVSLGECYPQPAVLDNKGYFFLGTDAEQVATPELDEGEDIEVVLLPINEIPDLIEKKVITHGMVMLSIFLYSMKKSFYWKI